MWANLSVEACGPLPALITEGYIFCFLDSRSLVGDSERSIANRLSIKNKIFILNAGLKNVVQHIYEVLT